MGETFAHDSVSTPMHLLVAVAQGRPPSFVHCGRLLERFGMAQFALGHEPDMDFGYCLDDNTRAFLAAVIALYLDPDLGDAQTVGEAALCFMESCRRPDGRFHNLMAADGSFTDEVGSQDSLGRLIWACGVGACCAPSAAWRDRARALLEAALEHTDGLTTLQPMSYAALGLAAAIAPELAAPIPPIGTAVSSAKIREALERLCASLAAELARNASEGWEWFEPLLTWGNARMPEALLRGALALGNPALGVDGLRALTFLASVTQSKDVFVPIGNHGWYERGGERAIYDQQPIEACAMVDAWLAAARLTGAIEYESKALEAFSWFVGLNTERLAVVEARSGGCRDGLGPSELNLNMGAESTLSYVHAHAALAAAFRRKTS
jgi:hypothetical protein